MEERWDDTNGYELYVGRWSRVISSQFIDWLDPQPGLKWLELGCGTGALTKQITERCSPSFLLAIDQSIDYLNVAKNNTGEDAHVSFLNADLNDYPLTERFDHIISGLVLNFIPGVRLLLENLIENLNSGGQLSAFVWDYGGHYQPMRHFWNAAAEILPAAESFDAGKKFELCTTENLKALLEGLGLKQVRAITIEQIATFKDFDDYWSPIATAQGSVTEFLSSLTVSQEDMLRENLRRRLPVALNGEIKLVISALAVKGTKN